jgi:acyl-CoA hydrolase
MPQKVYADEAIALLPHGARVLVQGAAGESSVLAAAAEAAAAAQRPDLRFEGVFLPGVNTNTYGAAKGCAVTTFFLTPELKAAGGGVEFLPIGYNDIALRLRASPPDAALFMASPPDAAGACSFGVAVDFLAELWPSVPIRIAHLNPDMPRTRGTPGIPFDSLTAFIEARTPLITLADAADDATRKAIGARVAVLVPDGAAVQAGIGNIPGACMRALAGKKGLRIHSGFVSDWAVDLLASGAVAAPVTTGLAIGSARLYAAASSEMFDFRPVSHTHAPDVLRGLEALVTINAALEVDLLGQVYSEFGPTGFASGPGGALDFARGAKLGGGLRIIALPSEARGASRIVGPGAGRGPVSLSRFDVDVVVTEHGATDLRGCSHDARAERLVAIAAPRHRGALAASWRAFNGL